MGAVSLPGKQVSESSMTHEQAYRAGQQDCRDGVPVEQGLEDFMRDTVTQTDALSVTQELEPCPFCGNSLHGPHPHEGGFSCWMHPGVVTDGTCLLSGQGFFVKDIAKWNTRRAAKDKTDNDAVSYSCCIASTSQGVDGRHAPTRLSHSTPGDAEVRKGLEIAQGIVESDLIDAKEHADADWIGQSQEALDAITAILATPSGSAQGEWLPIETAPKDGAVLVYGYSEDDWEEMQEAMEYGEPTDGITRHWFPATLSFQNIWWLPGGMMKCVKSPTHWQPLPAAPPAQDQTKGDE